MFGADVNVPFLDDAASPGGAGDGDVRRDHPRPGRGPAHPLPHRRRATAVRYRSPTRSAATPIHYEGVVVQDPAVHHRPAGLRVVHGGRRLRRPPRQPPLRRRHRPAVIAYNGTGRRQRRHAGARQLVARPTPRSTGRSSCPGPRARHAAADARTRSTSSRCSAIPTRWPTSAGRRCAAPGPAALSQFPVRSAAQRRVLQRRRTSWRPRTAPGATRRASTTGPSTRARRMPWPARRHPACSRRRSHGARCAARAMARQEDPGGRGLHRRLAAQPGDRRARQRRAAASGSSRT